MFRVPLRPFLIATLVIASGLTTTLPCSAVELASEPSSGPKVLSPDKFFGKAQAGYLAAQKVPEICAKLFCYCGCDLSDNHSSLLDCFTSDHGMDCSVCQDEALLALKMKNEGKSLGEIQKAVDTTFLKDYQEIFSKPSDALKKYRSERAWHPTVDEDLPQGSAAGAAGKPDDGSAKRTSDSSSPEAGSAAKPVSTTSAKPKQPSCCGGK
jgi:hypothetical protein